MLLILWVDPESDPLSSLGVGVQHACCDWCGWCSAVCCGLGVYQHRDAACHSCIKSCCWFKCQKWWSGCLRCQFQLATAGQLSCGPGTQHCFPFLHMQTERITEANLSRRASLTGFEAPSEGALKTADRACGSLHSVCKSEWRIQQATHQEGASEECFLLDCFSHLPLALCRHPPQTCGVWRFKSYIRCRSVCVQSGWCALFAWRQIFPMSFDHQGCGAESDAAALTFLLTDSSGKKSHFALLFFWDYFCTV